MSLPYWIRKHTRPVARISYGEVRIRAMLTNQRAPQAQAASGVWGYPPPENFEKFDCLRQHFVPFWREFDRRQGSESEGKKLNNSGMATLKFRHGNTPLIVNLDPQKMSLSY